MESIRHTIVSELRRDGYLGDVNTDAEITMFFQLPKLRDTVVVVQEVLIRRGMSQLEARTEKYITLIVKTLLVSHVVRKQIDIMITPPVYYNVYTKEYIDSFGQSTLILDTIRERNERGVDIAVVDVIGQRFEAMMKLFTAMGLQIIERPRPQAAPRVMPRAPPPTGRGSGSAGRGAPSQGRGDPTHGRGPLQRERGARIMGVPVSPTPPASPASSTSQRPKERGTGLTLGPSATITSTQHSPPQSPSSRGAAAGAGAVGRIKGGGRTNRRIINSRGTVRSQRGGGNNPVLITIDQDMSEYQLCFMYALLQCYHDSTFVITPASLEEGHILKTHDYTTERKKKNVPLSDGSYVFMRNPNKTPLLTRLLIKHTNMMKSFDIMRDMPLVLGFEDDFKDYLNENVKLYSEYIPLLPHVSLPAVPQLHIVYWCAASMNAYNDKMAHLSESLTRSGVSRPGIFKAIVRTNDQYKASPINLADHEIYYVDDIHTSYTLMRSIYILLTLISKQLQTAASNNYVIILPCTPDRYMGMMVNAFLRMVCGYSCDYSYYGKDEGNTDKDLIEGLQRVSNRTQVTDDDNMLGKLSTIDDIVYESYSGYIAKQLLNDQKIYNEWLTGPSDTEHPFKKVEPNAAEIERYDGMFAEMVYATKFNNLSVTTEYYDYSVIPGLDVGANMRSMVRRLMQDFIRLRPSFYNDKMLLIIYLAQGLIEYINKDTINIPSQYHINKNHVELMVSYVSYYLVNVNQSNGAESAIAVTNQQLLNGYDISTHPIGQMQPLGYMFYEELLQRCLILIYYMNIYEDKDKYNEIYKVVSILYKLSYILDELPNTFQVESRDEIGYNWDSIIMLGPDVLLAILEWCNYHEVHSDGRLQLEFLHEQSSTDELHTIYERHVDAYEEGKLIEQSPTYATSADLLDQPIYGSMNDNPIELLNKYHIYFQELIDSVSPNGMVGNIRYHLYLIQLNQQKIHIYIKSIKTRIMKNIGHLNEIPISDAIPKSGMAMLGLLNNMYITSLYNLPKLMICYNVKDVLDGISDTYENIENIESCAMSMSRIAALIMINLSAVFGIIEHKGFRHNGNADDTLIPIYNLLNECNPHTIQRIFVESLSQNMRDDRGNDYYKYDTILQTFVNFINNKVTAHVVPQLNASCDRLNISMKNVYEYLFNLVINGLLYIKKGDEADVLIPSITYQIQKLEIICEPIPQNDSTQLYMAINFYFEYNSGVCSYKSTVSAARFFKRLLQPVEYEVTRRSNALVAHPG